MREDKKDIDDNQEYTDHNQNEVENRINKLYGISSPLDKEPTAVYNPEQINLIRKKVYILLMIIILFGMLFIFVILNPLRINSKKSNITSDSNISTGNQNTDDVDIDDTEIPLGDIDLSNTTVIKLNNIIEFSLSDFYYVDPFIIYQNAKTTSSQIPNNLKMYILQRSEEFHNLLNSVNLEQYVSTCNSEGIVITEEQMNTVILKTLGPDVSFDNNPYHLKYYYDDIVPIDLQLVKKDNQYLLTCTSSTSNNNIEKYLQQKFERAVKTETGIELYHRIVFIRRDGVYSDANFNNLITNDPAAQSDDYLTKGSLYKYTFIMDQDKDYYLSSIELVKED